MKKIFGLPFWLWAGVASIYVLTLIFNDGFIAFDEYFIGVTRYIPAQTSDLQHLVGPDDVKSPLQLMPMHGLAQWSLALGIVKPYWQYRFVLTMLGLIHFLILALVMSRFKMPLRDIDETLPSMSWGVKERGVALALLGLFFLAPFTLTRPMFESLTAPWIALSVYFGQRYDENSRRSDLLWSVLCASMAFVMRQQVGACALACLLLPALNRRWGDFWMAAFLGLVLFGVVGIPDYFLRGSFHFSLWAILIYNIHHGAEYATHPITTYPLMIFGVCFGPWWLMKFEKGFWTQHWKTLRMPWLVLILFVVSHSLFPQKWERFLISMVPVLIILMVPLVLNLWQQRFERPWRWYSLIVINFILWFPSTFLPPQKNLIDMSLYLDQHSEIKTVYRVDHVPEWITEVFIEKKNFKFKEIREADLENLKSSNSCDELLIVRDSLKNKVSLKSWSYADTMKVNFLEKLAYKLNPKTNVRRTDLLVFNCSPKVN